MTNHIFWAMPANIRVDSEFWGREHTGQILIGEVYAILADSNGDQYCIFEMPDQTGLQIIHCRSNFFKGFSNDS